ncbi:MAG: hypothetical protein P1P86_10280 [Bacteroidales bacterium]|nr:hypothetical protein [Bacteroidales bacterium]
MNGKDEEQSFALVVGREAIIPIMNARHPQRDLIMKQGISPEQFRNIYTGQGTMTWGEVLGSTDASEVHVFVPGETTSAAYLAEFLGSGSGAWNGTAIIEPHEMLNRIGNDPQAIGFCSLASLMQSGNGEVDSRIGLVPVDADGDGSIGAFEDIYRSGSMLSHAIFVGRFPRSLYSRIYALTEKQPGSAAEMNFLEWLVNGGQETLAMAGILELGFGERNSRMEQLSGHEPLIVNVPSQSSPALVYLAVAGFLILLGTLVFLLTGIRGRKGLAPEEGTFQESGSKAFPGGLFFHRSHTWAFMEKSGRVRIGVDGFLPKVTGPVTRVVMKQPGEQIRCGEHFITLIQNGKRLEIEAPVSGIITEQNEELLHDASLLNSHTYSEGWILMVEPQNWISEMKSYFMGPSYSDWLQKEGVRLKDFFASVLKPEKNMEPGLVMQDGGEIKEGVLESFGPRVWEEFQEGFINPKK